MFQTLKAFMDIADKIIPKKTDQEIFRYVCVDQGFIRATDLDTVIKMPIKDTRNYLLPTPILKKILALKPDDLTIELGSDHKISIISKNKKITFHSLPPAEFPADLNEAFDLVAVWPAAVFQHLERLTLFTSSDDTRPALTGVFVQQDENVSAVATDGHILQWNKNLFGDLKMQILKPFKTIIPGKPLKAIAKFIHGPVKVYLAKQFIRFVLTTKLEITIRIINLPYVHFEAAFPDSFSNHLTIKRQELLQVITDTKKLATLTGEHIRLSGNNGTMHLSSSDFDSATTFETSIPIKNQNETPYEVRFDLNLFEKVVKAIPDEHIIWAYTDQDRPQVFYGSEHLKCLLMPLRGSSDDA